MLYLNSPTAKPSPELRRVLEAADGYLYLRMPAEALEELDSLPPGETETAPALLGKIRVLLHLRRWAEAESLSRLGVEHHPEENEFTVQRAFALHQLEQGEEASKVLLAAPEWIRRTGILHYNLACYEARLGDLKMARLCIDAAIEINAAMKKNARTDPDLSALWN